MASATARAEARRKAILSRGTDRLAKLTSSARGEDNPVYSSNDPIATRTTATENFIGEESTFRSSATQDAPTAGLDPSSNWSAEHQQEFLAQLLKASVSTDPSQQRSEDRDINAAEFEDPVAAAMSTLAQANEGNFGSTLNFTQTFQSSRSKTVLEKFSPLVHLLLTWFLLAFYVFVKEPEVYVSGAHPAAGTNLSQRWAELRYRRPLGSAAVQTVPFLWAFVSLQLVLHSIQIYTDSNPLQPPMPLQLAMPHLPPVLASWIVHGLKYIQIITALLDDFAGLIVGIGLLILLSGWIVEYI